MVQVRQLLQAGNFGALSKGDELQQARRAGDAFKGWSEGSLTFPPTYKFRWGLLQRDPLICSDVLSYIIYISSFQDSNNALVRTYSHFFEGFCDKITVSKVRCDDIYCVQTYKALGKCSMTSGAYRECMSVRGASENEEL